MSEHARAHRREEEELEAAEQRPATPPPAPTRGLLSRSQVLALQRSVGNAATRSLIQRQGEGGATATADPAQEQQPGAEPELAPETTKKDPEHPPAPKLKMDLASGEAVLTQAFGSVKKIVPGKIEILDPAGFQAAYDKIYGAGPWSWDKYVKPTYGSLNGFAHEGVNYINKGSAGLHTVVHEMLHNNAHASWTPFVGSRWDEGTTEVLTQEACKKVGEDAPVCYPGESPVIREAIANGMPLADIADAYFNGGAAFKIAKWINDNCKLNWASVKSAMESKDWAAAKAALAKK
jgi:hypothetical protein